MGDDKVKAHADADPDVVSHIKAKARPVTNAEGGWHDAHSAAEHSTAQEKCNTKGNPKRHTNGWHCGHSAAAVKKERVGQHEGGDESVGEKEKAEDTTCEAMQEHTTGSEVNGAVKAGEKKPRKKKHKKNENHVTDTAKDGTGKAAEKKSDEKAKKKSTQRIKGSRRRGNAKPSRRKKVVSTV